MAIARDMWPKSILGIDIDPSLISKARKMVNQYANRKVPSAMATPNPEVEPVTRKEQLFPQSLPMIFGPLDPTQPTPTMVCFHEILSCNFLLSSACSLFRQK